MASAAKDLKEEERRDVARYLSGRDFSKAPESIAISAYCPRPEPSWNPFRGSSWKGWGNAIANTRFQPRAAAGLGVEDVSRLKLRWAFGFPGDTSAGYQPTLSGGHLFVGSFGGMVYSLEAKTGCIHWATRIGRGVRTAVLIGKVKGGKVAAFFGDINGTFYALDAGSGKELWHVKVDDHPFAKLTGSPALFRERLYIPVSSYEEVGAAKPEYTCCTFRGSVVALDASNGHVVWKSYAIREKPVRRPPDAQGTVFIGPSGAAIFNAPTIDPRRRVLYVGTGNGYSPPATETSDAILAMDLDTGDIKWSHQIRAEDVWNLACSIGGSNCPIPHVSETDIASAPVLVEGPGHKSVLIAAWGGGIQALDPDRKGKVLWQYKGYDLQKRFATVKWGPAADAKNVYVAMFGAFLDKAEKHHDINAGGGLFAFDFMDGAVRWYAPPTGCGDRTPCRQGQPAAVTATDGAVFSGSIDGHLRAYATKDGKLLWDYDTIHPFATVNSVEARGGSIDYAGPSIVDGMVFATSGYVISGRPFPGNVLMAFSSTGDGPE